MNVSVRAALQAREERAGRAREGRAARTADVPTERRVLILVAGGRFFSWGKKTRSFLSIRVMKINLAENQTKAQAPGSGDNCRSTRSNSCRLHL